MLLKMQHSHITPATVIAVFKSPTRLLFVCDCSFLIVSSVGWDWVHLVHRPLTGLLYQPRMIDDECGAVGGMRIGRGNWSTRRKPAPVSLSAPQIPYNLNWARTRPAAFGSRWLTAWAMERPSLWEHVTDHIGNMFNWMQSYLETTVNWVNDKMSTSPKV
jgi:hypothetical protein